MLDFAAFGVVSTSSREEEVNQGSPYTLNSEELHSTTRRCANGSDASKRSIMTSKVEALAYQKLSIVTARPQNLDYSSFACVGPGIRNDPKIHLEIQSRRFRYYSCPSSLIQSFIAIRTAPRRRIATLDPEKHLHSRSSQIFTRLASKVLTVGLQPDTHPRR